MKRLSLLALALALTTALQLAGQPLNQRVLIVHNTAQAESLEIAQYYQAKRSIPAANLCGVPFTNIDLIPESEWLSAVRTGIRNCLNTVGRTNILYIVFSYKTPYIVYRGSNNMALDSYAGDIWDAISSVNFPSSPAGNHRYYVEPQTSGNYYPAFQAFDTFRAQPRSPVIYAHSRLDAPSKALVQGMIDNAFNVEAAGGLGATRTAYIDRQADNAFLDGQGDVGIWAGDFDLRRAGEAAAAAGLTVVEDQVYVEMGKAGATVSSAPNAGLYCGWYGIFDYQDIFSWQPGSVGWHLDSGSAVNPRSGPSWAAQALSRGLTVTSGAVNEPYLQGLSHPDVAFRHLLAGGTVGDAFLRSNPWLKWRVINLGDPLYRPFPGGRAPFNSGVLNEDSVRLNPPDILSGTAPQFTITLKNPAPPGGQDVNLFSTWAPFYVPILPATITIPAGQRTYTYNWGSSIPVPNDILGVLVRASYGSVSNTATLRLYPHLQGISAASSITGGASATIYVVLNALAPAGGLTVSLSSSAPGVLQVPSSVTVPAGAQVAAVPVTTTVVGAAQAVTVTAIHGVRTTTASINVTP